MNSTSHASVVRPADGAAQFERERIEELERLALVARCSGDGAALADEAGRITWVNDSFVRVTGFSGEDAMLRTPRDLLTGPETREETIVALQNALATHTTWLDEMVVYRKSGRPVWVELSVSAVEEPTDASAWFVLRVRDVSARRLAERRNSQLTAAVEASLDGIAIIDAFQDFRYVNDAFAQLHGFASAEAMTGTSWRSLYDDEELSRVEDDILPHLYLGDRWRGESVGRRVDGSRFPQDLALTLLPGGIIVCVVSDITDRRETEESLRRISLLDPLTGLHNRRGFLMLAEQAIHGASRVPGHTLLLYFDVNELKSINDTFGHIEGDGALADVGDVLRATFRESDVLGRVGGDEFVVLAPNCLDPSGAVLQRRLDDQLAMLNSTPGRRYSLSLGRGMARFDPEHPALLAELLESADRDLYSDKRRRKLVR